MIKSLVLLMCLLWYNYYGDNMKEKSVSKSKDLVLLIIIGLCLFVPAFLQQLVNLGAHKQLIIGTIVNSALFASALYISDNKKIIALSLLPSISSMATGILFGGLTYYSKLMIPFIWIGNLSLVYLTKLLMNKIKYIPAGIVGIVVKVSVIYGGFLLLTHIVDFPAKVASVMGTAMGITQVYTASLGFIVSLIIIGVRKIRN